MPRNLFSIEKRKLHFLITFVPLPAFSYDIVYLIITWSPQQAAVHLIGLHQSSFFEKSQHPDAKLLK